MEQNILPDFQEETERLAQTRSYLDATIALVVDKRLKFKSDMKDAFKELDDMDSSLSYASILLNAKLLDDLEANFTLLKNARKAPYFARIDLRQEDKDRREKLYLGKISLFDDSMETPMVVDWRAPIASVYYDGRLGKASYKAHGKEYAIELFLKRQYTILEGELKSYMDVDVSMSDTFLQASLENHASEKLKDIVSTIQAEQNDIIRAPIHRPLIVQGVAGSGKTTIALHRIAYLIYTYAASFRPEDFMIIAPNSLFLDYISGVLPELGADQVKQTTYKDLMLGFLGKRLKIAPHQDKLAKLVRRGKGSLSAEEKETLVQVSALKNSMDMRSLLDFYLEEKAQGMIPDEDYTVAGKVLFKKEYLFSLFHESYGYLPLYRRLDSMKKYLQKFTREEVKKMESRVNLSYESKMASLRILEAPGEERRQKLLALMAERDQRLKEIQAEGKNAVNRYLAMIPREEPLTLYRRLMADETWLTRIMDETLAQEVIVNTMALAKAKQVELEDLAPLVYLKEKLEGLPEAVKVKNVVIDEAQDFSAFQIWVLREVLHTERFTILGDLSQGIHMYRAVKSWEELLTGVFQEEATLLTLEQSYRTTIEIMNLANEVLRQSPMKELTLATPVVRHGEAPQLLSYGETKALVLGLAKSIEAFADEGYTTQAVITKSVEEAQRLHGLLLKECRLPVALLSDQTSHFQEKIVILPAHLAKGLEFDAVLVAADDDTFGLSELDAKLLYVAMTRALHRLSLHIREGAVPLLDQAGFSSIGE